MSEADGETLLQAHCTECHGLEDVDAHGPDDLAGWRSVVAAMVEEGAEYTEEQGELCAVYLAQKYPAAEEVAVEVIEVIEIEEEEVEEVEETATPAEPESKPKPRKRKASGSAAAGRPIFQAKCKACHGPDGKGNTAYGKKVGIRSLARTSLSRGRVKAIIADGMPGTKMKAYRDKLTPQQLDDVTAFVKALR